MTLIIDSGYTPLDDPDAAVYIAAVQAADEAASPGVGALEDETKAAIHAFVKGCKVDGIWPAIKASCILAGARTLEGALVPLAGTSPTNVSSNFVSGDYNRKTGLTGDGSTKSLDSNRNNNADPQNNAHASVYVSSVGTLPTSPGLAALMGMGNNSASNRLLQLTSSGPLQHKLFNISGTSTPSAIGAGFHGISRSNADNYGLRSGSNTSTIAQASTGPTNGSLTLFNRNNANYSSATLAFYSIGESLNLALLDARVTALITAFGAAIP